MKYWSSFGKEAERGEEGVLCREKKEEMKEEFGYSFLFGVFGDF